MFMIWVKTNVKFVKVNELVGNILNMMENWLPF